MKLQRIEKILLSAAVGCAAWGGWLWWSDRPALAYAERHDLAGLTVHEPAEFAVELNNTGDEPRKVIGARAY